MASEHLWWPLHHIGLSHSSHMPFDANPDFAKYLGLILERWTLIESTLATALGYLIEDNEQAARAIIYSLNSTSTRIAIVRSVARELMPEGPEKRAFVYMLDKINDLQKRRNELVHGEYWHGENDKLELYLRRPMNAEPFVIRPISLEQLKEHVAKCEEWDFRLTLAIDPLPQKTGRLRAYWHKRNEQLQHNYYHAVAMAKRRGEPPPPRPAWYQ